MVGTISVESSSYSNKLKFIKILNNPNLVDCIMIMSTFRTPTFWLTNYLIVNLNSFALNNYNVFNIHNYSYKRNFMLPMCPLKNQ
jgi:hypothetical protein